ncbi:hypothetical protein [Acinetobacter phage Ab69]|nr:hypothetical protein [Acinetobacter phage Ab69]
MLLRKLSAYSRINMVVYKVALAIQVNQNDFIRSFLNILWFCSGFCCASNC